MARASSPAGPRAASPRPKAGARRGTRTAPRRTPPPRLDAAQDLVLHAALRDVAPTIWRRLRVPDRLTLHQLHRVLQLAFGWLDYHLYEFTPALPAPAPRRGVRGPQEHPQVRYAEPDPEWDDPDGGVETRDSRRVTLRDLALTRGARLTYRYDFGDDWVHDLTVEQTVSVRQGEAADDDGRPLPMILDGARAGPPEDAGGPPGYERLLAVLGNPDDPEHHEMKAWAALWGGVAYDPERFDPWTANHTLMLVAAWGAL